MHPRPGPEARVLARPSAGNPACQWGACDDSTMLCTLAIRRSAKAHLAYTSGSHPTETTPVPKTKRLTTDLLPPCGCSTEAVGIRELAWATALLFPAWTVTVVLSSSSARAAGTLASPHVVAGCEPFLRTRFSYQIDAAAIQASQLCPALSWSPSRLQFLRATRVIRTPALAMPN